MLIEDGIVTVNGTVASRPSHPVAATDTLALTGQPFPYVSRAALKLAAALDHFKLSPKGQTVLDLGASTGGFTQILLERGASKVVALDVGHNQMAPDLKDDARVIAIEGVNAKNIAEITLPDFTMLTADLSFISLEKALPAALQIAQPNSTLVALIKPQFEVGHAAIGKGGIVTDSKAQQNASNRIFDFLTAHGWKPSPPIESPIKGGDGNTEFLITAEKQR